MHYKISIVMNKLNSKKKHTKIQRKYPSYISMILASKAFTRGVKKKLNEPTLFSPQGIECTKNLIDIIN